MVRFDFSSRAARKAPDLATIIPRNHSTEEYMQPAETGSEENVLPARRAKQRNCAQNHEAEAHQGDNADGKRAAGDNSGAVQQEPDAGNGVSETGAHENDGKQGADKQRRREAVDKAAARAGEKGRACITRLRKCGPGSDGDSHEGFADPGEQPGYMGGLARSDGRGAESRDAHGHAAPAGDGGE